ncbi:MAG: ABC transporter ATP-binding protein/permease [Lachnospiraceae bacterium]|nr:ABC transporter ATP-binding protein/permease [Lachnospiraceae bacterium]
MIKMLHSILRFTGKYARRIRLAYIVSFFKSICTNFPIMMAVFVVDAFIRGEAGIGECVLAAVAIMAVFGIHSALQVVSDRLQSGTGYMVFADKRKEFGEHLKRLPMGFFTEGNVGKISTILSQDMVYIEEQSMTIIADAVMDMCTQALMIIFLAVINPLLGAIALAFVTIIVIVAQFMIVQSKKGAEGRNIAIEDLTSAVLEYTEGMPIIKSFCLTGRSAKDVRESFAKMKDSSLEFENRLVPFEIVMALLYGLGRCALLVGTIWLFQKGELTPTFFVATCFLIFTAFTAIKHLYQQTTRLTLMTDSLSRIKAVFDMAQIEEKKNDEPAFDDVKPEVEFENVSFAYTDEEVLNDVSFKADRGSMTALVGASGGGKSTVANLLARFWDVKSGSIKIRGVDIRDMSLEALMNMISMVFQRVYLFNDTIYNNIAMAKPQATREEVFEAARRACCYDFIMKLPFGFDTIIGEGGSSLSGGEAQRISIARCILKDAPIIILDEATASIDADNEKNIREAMTELCRGKTTIVIAHRLYTIREADNIIVIDRGRIAQSGRRDELLRVGGAYRRLEEAADD